MRNYFKTLGLDVSASKEHLQKVLDVNKGEAANLNPRHQVDALEVLLDEQRLDVYASAALLYETLGAAAGCLDEPIAKNTHQWQARLSEFETTESEHNN